MSYWAFHFGNQFSSSRSSSNEWHAIDRKRLVIECPPHVGNVPRVLGNSAPEVGSLTRRRRGKTSHPMWFFTSSRIQCTVNGGGRSLQCVISGNRRMEHFLTQMGLKETYGQLLPWNTPSVVAVRITLLRIASSVREPMLVYKSFWYACSSTVAHSTRNKESIEMRSRSSPSSPQSCA